MSPWVAVLLARSVTSVYFVGQIYIFLLLCDCDVPHLLTMCLLYGAFLAIAMCGLYVLHIMFLCTDKDCEVHCCVPWYGSLDCDDDIWGQ